MSLLQKKIGDRITFVDKHTMHILGEIIPEGAERGPGSPIHSALDKEKADRKRGRKKGQVDWSREGQRVGVTKEEAKQKSEKLAQTQGS